MENMEKCMGEAEKLPEPGSEDYLIYYADEGSTIDHFKHLFRVAKKDGILEALSQDLIITADRMDYWPINPINLIMSITDFVKDRAIFEREMLDINKNPIREGLYMIKASVPAQGEPVVIKKEHGEFIEVDKNIRCHLFRYSAKLLEPKKDLDEFPDLSDWVRDKMKKQLEQLAESKKIELEARKNNAGPIFDRAGLPLPPF